MLWSRHVYFYQLICKWPWTYQDKFFMEHFVSWRIKIEPHYLISNHKWRSNGSDKFSWTFDLSRQTLHMTLCHTKENNTYCASHFEIHSDLNSYGTTKLNVAILALKYDHDCRCQNHRYCTSSHFGGYVRVVKMFHMVQIIELIIKWYGHLYRWKYQSYNLTQDCFDNKHSD